MKTRGKIIIAILAVALVATGAFVSTQSVFAQSSNLTGTCSVDQNTIEVGDSVTFTANASGGTGAYDYRWSGSGISFYEMYELLDSDVITRTYRYAGVQTVYVKITSGTESITRTCIVHVEESENDLDGSCIASPSSGDVDETITWKATATGGDGNYTYSWSGTNSLSGSSRTVNKSYSTAGTKSASVFISSDGETIARTCSIRIDDPDSDNDNDNNNDLDVSCRANPRMAAVDERVTFTATVSGGNSPYDYEWDGDDSLSGTSRTITHRYDSRGTYEAEIQVQDDDGNRERATCEVDIQTSRTTGSIFGGDFTNDDVVVLTESGTTNQTSAVYLSQLPYTGTSSKNVIIYLSALFLWSVIITFLIVKRKHDVRSNTLVSLHNAEINDRITNLRIAKK